MNRRLPITHRLQGLFCVLLMLHLGLAPLAAADSDCLAGVAQIDITPDYPIRLNGFGFRRAESEGVGQRIWAKALAFGDDALGPAILVTVDNLAVPDYLTQAVAGRLEKKTRLSRARFTVTCTHTHTAPMLKDVCPTIFGVPIPPEHLEHIERYTGELTDKLEAVALAALRDVKPARLEFGLGEVGFAVNRRTKGGPVDHDLPVLAVKDLQGKLRALYVSYACHCVTLSDNQISGDWAGYAQEQMQKDHPGAIALMSVGCGADSNPSSGVTGNKVESAADQGAQIADEVNRLLKQVLPKLTGKLITRWSRIELPFDKHPTREEWQEKAKRADAVGYHARVQLAKLDRGEKLQAQLSYPIQTWAFGDQLALVFLPGEVVVDYSLRLKREFDRARLWVNGYANDEPCYIPSERVLKEGGYEGGDAMIYYDRPTRFAPGLEQKIINEVHQQLPGSLLAPKGTEGTSPRSPLESLGMIRTKPGLEVELAAAEPLVESPVAIDWGADGKLWVCEMYDYPTGVDGNWKAGGRIKFLEDTNGDGKYDKATVFLDNVPFPTGVTAWRKGVLICAAPDILYAEDTDGDGKADLVKKVFTGFYTDNYQARVNGLSLGLDNWIYGANGLLGGIIRGEIKGKELNIRGQDFRMKPETGEFEPASGLTQQGRVRDDWGNWFGCDNSVSLRHYPLPDQYVRRNPRVPAPDPSVYVPNYPNSNRVFPISRALERFNEPDQLNHVTSACGLGIYRDELLGAGYYGNAFVCEPVHNLVHREVLEPKGVTFTSHRAADEQDREFLASTDNWFRPVQVRTGPDGALWVVDMYRFLIEHPRWIQAERLAQIDARAGADRGRVYRVMPKGKKLRPVRDLNTLSGANLVAALDTPNGMERDRVHLELLRRADGSTIEPLTKLAAKGARPAVRVQALSVLAAFDPLMAKPLAQALNDVDPEVRRQAVRLSEPILRNQVRPAPSPATKTQHAVQVVKDRLFKMVNDPDLRVREQLALSLGEAHDGRSAVALGEIARAGLSDPWLRAAVLTSAQSREGEIFQSVLSVPEESPARQELLSRLITTATAGGLDDEFDKLLTALLPADDRPLAGWQWTSLAALLSGLDADLSSLHAHLAGKPDLRSVEPRLRKVLSQASSVARNETAWAAEREAAIRLLGRSSDTLPEDIKLLRELLASGTSDGLRATALASLRRLRSPLVPAALLASWKDASPSVRAEILGVLLSREAWLPAVLAAVRGGAIQPSEITLADRQHLLHNQKAEVRELASALFASAGTQSRSEVLQKYQGALLLAGVANRGKEIFSRNCATCHALAGIGHEVGPNLAPLHDKEPEYLLKNILDPNAVIEPRFVSYNVLTRDGRSLSGVLQGETSTSLTLVQGGGLRETILRSEIAEIRASGQSLMPEGLEQAMTPQDLADLIAFLKQSGPPKTLPGNQPAIVKPAADGSFYLSATSAEIYGGDIVFEPDFKSIGMWHGAQDHTAWSVEVDRAATCDVHFDFACHPVSAGNAYVLDAAGTELRGTVPSTGGWDHYQRMKIGTIDLKPGQQRVTLRSAGELTNALIDLRAVMIVPAGIAPRWPAQAAGD